MGQHQKPVVLVVEDEPSIAETLVYALETEGFLTELQGTVSGALETLAQGGPFACAVLDIGLPDGNGFDLCRSIHDGLEDDGAVGPRLPFGHALGGGHRGIRSPQPHRTSTRQTGLACRVYSYRRARTGSRRDARHAGP